MADANKFDHELLLAAVEGELTAPQRKQVEQMITEDPRVGKLLEAMRADRQALRAMPDPAAPHWLMDEVDRQLERDMLMGSGVVDSQVDAVREAHVFRRFMVYGAVAAMFAIVATVILSSLSTPEGDPIGPVAIDKPGTAETPVKPDDTSTDPTPVIGDSPKPKDPILAVGPTEKPTPATEVIADPGPISIDEALASAADAARDPQLLASLVIGEAGAAMPADPPVVQRNPIPGIDGRDEPEPYPGTFSQPGPGSRITDLVNDPTLPKSMPRPTPTPGSDTGDDTDSGASPGDADRIDERTRPVFQVADRDATLKRIDRLAEQFGGVRVPGASDEPGTVVYRVDADRLRGFINALSDAVGEGETLKLDRAVADRPKLDDNPWPSIVPDYLSILNQQFEDDAKAAPVKVELPVKVTQGKTSE